MIELEVEEYCQSCKAFSPVSNTIEYSDRLVRTSVKCEYAKRCAGIARHIRTELSMRERSDDMLNEEKLKN